MSETVSIPAKQDFSLFHRGADTTPGWVASNWQISQVSWEDYETDR